MGRPRGTIDVKIRFFIIAALLFVFPLLNSQHATTYESNEYCADEFTLELLGLINDYREDNGRAPLLLSSTLGAAAQHHVDDMIEHNYFGHTLSDGTTWGRNIYNHGYTFTTYKAENIASSPTALGVFTQWKNSSGHNANLLNSRYKMIGIGWAYDSTTRYDWYEVATFGGRVDATAPTCA